jgi:hypothetical protein
VRPDQRAAIARVDVAREDAAPLRGTAFLVAPGLALTAFHVVGDRRSGAPHPGPVRLTFPGGETAARFVEGDAALDWALLACDAAAAPLPLAEAVAQGEPFECYGFPELKPDGLHAHGTVADLSATEDPVPRIGLDSPQLKREQVSGVSGAPVLVGGAVVAIVDASLLDRAQENRAGALYALPIAAVRCERLPVPDPCRGLPGLPRLPLPASPFRYLARFGAADAEVFFGRERPLRALYERLVDPQADPVLLFYGQSGVGKSSLLEAGLAPRLAATHDVRVVRRDPEKGLAATLAAIAPAGRQLVVVLDQCEEAFTRGGPPDEWARLAEALRGFAGRVVLSFRKEWLPEVEAALAGVAFGKLYVDRIDREGVIAVVQGLTRTRRLRDRYGLSVDPGLAEMIADDLLDDPASPVTPALQILLTRLWAEASRAERPRFTVAQYREAKQRGLHLSDFLAQQLEAVRSVDSTAVDSGLALDVLAFHTTPLGTARARTSTEVAATYAHGAPLVAALRDASLLVDDEGGTRLTHDTLAPIVRRELDASDRPGQRARRILESRAVDWSGGDGPPLDAADYDRVMAGLAGMRDPTPDERRLLDASAAAREAERRSQAAARRARRVAATVVALLGLAVAVASVFLYRRNAELRETRHGRAVDRAWNHFASSRIAAERQDVLTEILHVAEALKAAPSDDPGRAAWIARLLALAPLAPSLVADLGPVQAGAVDAVRGRAFVVRPDGKLEAWSLSPRRPLPVPTLPVVDNPVARASVRAPVLSPDGRFAAIFVPVTPERLVAWEVESGRVLLAESVPSTLQPLLRASANDLRPETTGDETLDEERYGSRVAFGADGWLTLVSGGTRLVGWHLAVDPPERRELASELAAGALTVAPAEAGRPWVPLIADGQIRVLDLAGQAPPAVVLPQFPPGSVLDLGDVRRPVSALHYVFWWRPERDATVLRIGMAHGREAVTALPTRAACTADGCAPGDEAATGRPPPWAEDPEARACGPRCDGPMPAIARGVLREWDAGMGADAVPPRALTGWVGADWAADGKALVTLSADGRVLRWPLIGPPAARPVALGLDRPLLGAAFDAEATRALVVSGQKAAARITVVDLASGAPRWPAPVPAPGGIWVWPAIHGFSADGASLLVARWPAANATRVEVWDAAAGTVGPAVDVPGHVDDSAIASDGTLRVMWTQGLLGSGTVTVQAVDRRTGTSVSCTLPPGSSARGFTRAPGLLVARGVDVVDVRRAADV